MRSRRGNQAVARGVAWRFGWEVAWGVGRGVGRWVGLGFGLGCGRGVAARDFEWPVGQQRHRERWERLMPYVQVASASV